MEPPLRQWRGCVWGQELDWVNLSPQPISSSERTPTLLRTDIHHQDLGALISNGCFLHKFTHASRLGRAQPVLDQLRKIHNLNRLLPIASFELPSSPTRRAVIVSSEASLNKRC